MVRSDIKVYRPNLKPDARDPLMELAESLGFIVTREGMYEGEPSVRDLLHALAAAYRRDPAGVKLAFKVLGITPDGKATFSSHDGGDAAE